MQVIVRAYEPPARPRTFRTDHRCGNCNMEVGNVADKIVFNSTGQPATTGYRLLLPIQLIHLHI